jgi:uncharacterized protein YciI
MYMLRNTEARQTKRCDKRENSHISHLLITLHQVRRAGKVKCLGSFKPIDQGNYARTVIRPRHSPFPAQILNG